MVEVLGAEAAEADLEAHRAPLVMEGDFTPRKIKVASGILIGQSFGTSILPYSALMLMLMPLTKQFGWSAAQFSWSVTCLFVAGALSLWPIGRLADKFGVRPVLLFGTIAVGLITLGMAFQTKSLWQFYAYYALLGIFGSTGVTYTKVVAALFTQNRGKAMAVLTAETTLARAGVPLVVNWLLLTHGWQTMYLVFGIVILATVPVLFFTLEEPGETGTAGKFSWLRNKSAAANAAPPPPKAELPGMTIWEALQDPVFWLVTLAAFIGLFIFNGLFPHLIPALVHKGFSQTTVVRLQSASIVISFVGALIGGWAVDRFQTPKIAVPVSLAAALGAFLTLLVMPAFGGVPLLAAILILSSLAFNALFPMGTYFATRFFGLGSLTEIVAVQFAITNVFAGLSAPLFGWIFDTTHSYNIVFMITTGLNLVVALIWLVMPKYRYAANIGQMAAAPAPRPDQTGRVSREAETRMRFRNPANGHVESKSMPAFWCFLFGPFYFMVSGVWSHALIMLVLNSSFIVVLGKIGVVPVLATDIAYCFFARSIIERSYLRHGWERIDGGSEAVEGSVSHGTRKCPFCAETIRYEAVKCKHCGSALEAIA